MSLPKETIELILKTLEEANLKAGEFVVTDEEDSLKCVIAVAVDEKAEELSNVCANFFGKNIEEDEEDDVWFNSLTRVEDD